MTSRNNRAKKEARDRQKATGETYTAARRHTAVSRVRQFIDDCCANCLQPLPLAEEKLFCSPLCRYTADTVRYSRRVVRDGRIDKDPDVLRAVQTRVAFILAGGYDREGRALPRSVRESVWQRDAGQCQSCEKPGEEIDHIDGSSPDPANLQLLCKECHHAKTALRMVPASPTMQAEVESLFTTRVAVDEPILLSDDEVNWSSMWAGLKKARSERFYSLMLENGRDPDDYPPANRRREMVADLEDMYADAYSDSGRTADDDSGYGPGSYYAHAMAKDD